MPQWQTADLYNQFSCFLGEKHMRYSSFFTRRRSILRCNAFGSLVFLSPVLFLICGNFACAQQVVSRNTSDAVAPKLSPEITEAVTPSVASLYDTASDWMKRGADLEAAGKY